MRLLVWNIVLAALWAAMTGDFSAPNLFIGFAIGFVVLIRLRSVVQDTKYFSDVWELVGLAWHFVYELVLANIRMTYYIVMPLSRMRPGVIAVPLEPMNETEVTLLANLITLTPGTLSVDVIENPRTHERVLYVHVMHHRDADSVRREIKSGFETRVREALR